MGTDEFRYELSAFNIVSSFPFTLLAANSGASPTKTIIRVRTADAIPSDEIVWTGRSGVVRYGSSGTKSIVEYERRGQIAFDNSSLTVDCAPLPGVAQAVIEPLVLDHVIPRMLYGPDRMALHASAVGGAAAVLFVGSPGAGKSTTAASLVPPLRLIADDTALVERRSNVFVVHPSYAFARLEPNAAAAIRPGHASEPLWGKHRVALDAEQRVVRIGSLISICRGARASLERTHTSDAVDAVVRQVKRPFRREPFEILAELEFVTGLVAGVRCYTLTLPTSPGFAGLVSMRSVLLSLADDPDEAALQ